MFAFPLKFEQSIAWKKGQTTNLDAAIAALVKISLTDKERDEILRSMRDGSLDSKDENN